MHRRPPRVTIAFLFLAVGAVLSGSRGVAMGQEVRVIAENAPVRLQPDMDSRVIADMAAGTLLQVAQARGEWIVVYLPAEPGSARRVGYILASNVERFPPVDSTDTTRQDVSETASLPCENWNTKAYFDAASFTDVTRCLEGGADPRAVDKYDITPLHYAAWSGNAEVVEILLRAGASADVRTKDAFDATPLHYGARFGDAEMVEVLVGAGADANSEGQMRQTPLSIAIATGSEEVVQALRDLGAVPRGWEGKSICGETPDTQLMVVYGPDPEGVWAGVGETATSGVYSLYWGIENTEAEAMDQAANAALVAEKLSLDYDSTDPASFWPRVKPLLLSCPAAYFEDGDTFRVQVYVMPYTMIETNVSGLPWHGYDFRLDIR